MTKCRVVIWIAVFLLLPLFAIANVNFPCKKLSFLKNGLDLADLNKCHNLLKNCPANGPFPNQNCVKQIVARNPICYQLNQLSKYLNGSPSTISASPINRYTLIDQFFPADGQNSYYVITPQNCLINTKIDPRNLDPKLRKAYKNTPFIIVNFQKPNFVRRSNGRERMFATLKITKTCLACEVIGYARIQFDFDNKGRLVNITLDPKKLMHHPGMLNNNA